ncbi:NADP-dependent oxidoreductase [Sphingomonas sp.]|uniref:NADP-dependent oxidoreductase n=1 Tax=Sphingomonas sp. TaxID=28214 RepID=UPI0025CC3910|nr:NADP-dependent oxidoreductase [Sphingomonas sp.]
MAKAWSLRSRPSGMPTADNFDLLDRPSLPLGEGEIRVANSWLSVDPYMRGRMNDVKSYAEPFQIGEPMQGGAVGTVVESRTADFGVGDQVLHMLGWRDEAVMAAAAAQKLPKIGVPIQTFLHNLGLTGGTAYFGLLHSASAKAGDIVFVSAAAGAVGSAVVQIAKAKGMTVIGSAGGTDKCAWVRELGADACIDYKAGPVLPQLRDAAPKGIDVYFDNVGGEHLDAAYATARLHARFAICGMIDVYNHGEPMIFKHFVRTIPARIRSTGFLFTDFLPQMGKFTAEAGALIAAGKLKARETIFDGVESAPEAFLGLFSGANTGKMLVRL